MGNQIGINKAQQWQNTKKSENKIKHWTEKAYGRKTNQKQIPEAFLERYLFVSKFFSLLIFIRVMILVGNYFQIQGFK